MHVHTVQELLDIVGSEECGKKYHGILLGHTGAMDLNEQNLGNVGC